jgi:hypothetical protein
MTAISTASAAPANPLAEVFRRQPALAVLGLAFAILFAPAMFGVALDPRTLDGAPVWLKPAKFLLSTSLYAFTLAWFFGYVAPDARRGPAARAVAAITVAASVFEVGYIAFQASRAERSHFNTTDVFHIAMYSAMGVVIVTMVSTLLVLAWLIARRPVPGLRAPYRDAVVLGLIITFLLGGGFGGYMSSQTSHWVNAAASAGPGLPLFGWSTTGGDLRPAHFFGIHAQQILPFLALFVPGTGPLSRLAVWLIAAAYAAFTTAVFWHSLQGLPLIAL